MMTKITMLFCIYQSRQYNGVNKFNQLWWWLIKDFKAHIVALVGTSTFFAKKSSKCWCLELLHSFGVSCMVIRYTITVQSDLETSYFGFLFLLIAEKSHLMDWLCAMKKQKMSLPWCNDKRAMATLSGTDCSIKAKLAHAELSLELIIAALV